MSEISQYRSFSIRRLLQLHTALWHGAVSDEITSVQYGVLLYLDEVTELAQGELLHRAPLDKSTLAELLLRMERNGLVSTRRDGDDKRRKVVTITEEGRRVLAELRPAALRANDALTHALSDEERETFDALLARILGQEQGD